MQDPLAGTLPGPLEDDWGDFERSRRRKGRSAQTVALYRRSYEAFWTWALARGVKPEPAAVTRRDINAWVDHLLAQPVTRNHRTITVADPQTGEQVPKLVDPNTVRIRWQNLRPFFSWWAKEMGSSSPFADADAPKLVEAPVDVIPLDTIRAILRECSGQDFDDRRDTALIRLMADVGARVGELAAMTVDSWDRRSDRVHLVGKTGERWVPVSPSTGEALARYVRFRRRHPSSGVPALWWGRKGALGVAGIEQALARRSKAAGVGRIHPHALRHTWAHELKAAGAAEGDLMALGGWSTSAMVHRYGKSAAAARAEATARKIALGDRL